MKKYIFVFAACWMTSSLCAQGQPGLHVAENQTVLFGKDTTSTGIKLLWYPSKAAFRAGKTNTSEWIQENVGVFSGAFGVDTEARGNYSFTTGLSTWANSFAESSFGQYSLGGGSVTTWVSTDPLFEVGNGLGSAARANAFTIYKNGTAEFQRSIKLGNHTGNTLSDGTLRYSGSDIQGRVGGVWRSLTSGSGSGGSTPWTTSGSNISYNSGNIGLGTNFPTDNITIRGVDALNEDIGLSLINSFSIGLPGQNPTTVTKHGRVWQSSSSLNMGMSDGSAVLRFYDTAIDLFSPVVFTNWGFDFRHNVSGWSNATRVQTWLKKAWRGDLGDYLYIGSTGNRPISDQHAMVLSQGGGIQFGRGNTNDGDGLSSSKIRMIINSTRNDIYSTEPLDFLADGNISFYRTGGAGGVTIGTSNLPPDYRLAVDGKIASEEVLVQLSGNWPDYVFDEEYDLLDLDELESYTQKNNHLPGIPAAHTIEEQGIEVGEMQKMQMEKIEELTLYILELHKEIKQLKSKVDSQ